MNKSTIARIGIAGAVAGAGLAAAGVAVTQAEPADQPGSSTSAPERPDGPPDGPRGDHGGPGHDAAALAEALGLEEDVVAQALEEARDELRPDPGSADDEAPPTPPTDAERAEEQAALATALASKLGVSEDDVTAALEALQQQADADREERRAEDRTALVERLDAAVADGTLTEADKTSVLKAYDADLLGGGGPGGHGPGGPGGGPGRGPGGGPEDGPGDTGSSDAPAPSEQPS